MLHELLISGNFWAVLAQALVLSLLSFLGHAVLKYLKEIRNDLRRNLWQNDVMWSVFCLERNIPMESARYAGTERGKQAAVQIIAAAKAKGNGKAAHV